MADSEGGGGGGGSVVALEDAVQALMELLVQPLLPRSSMILLDKYRTPERHEAVARQMHAAVILYNYYHRKQFPQLAFAHVKQFCVSAALAAKEPLFIYLNIGNESHNNSGQPDKKLSVTEKAVMDACGIAEALDATKDHPDMIMWPISKVAVFLINQTKEHCLLQRGSVTQGVWSLVEKEINLHSSNQPRKQASTNKATINTFDEAHRNMLQQLAFSEVEHQTGMKCSSLYALEEHQTYSLSKEKTAAMLLIMQYEQIVNSNFVEVPIQHVINSLGGPLVENDLYPSTTSAVEYYHILPYKDILSNCLHRGWPSDDSLKLLKHTPCQNGKCSLESEINENLGEQEANSKSTREQPTAKVPTQMKSKMETEVVGNSSNSSTSKTKKNTTQNSKRRSEVSRPTAAEGCGSGRPAKAKKSPVVADGKTLELFAGSVNAQATETTSRGIVVPDPYVQMDKRGVDKQSISGDTPQYVCTNKAAGVNPVMKHDAVESLHVPGKSDGITSNRNDKMYASLQSLRRIRDNFHQKQRNIEDQIAQCEMDIQTILTDGEMTPKVMSIIERYDDCNSSVIQVDFPSCSGEKCQAMNIKRKRLSEAVLNLRSSCQELDEICRENNWILPRYTVLPSVTDGMYQAIVNLKGLDFNFTADGDLRITPREARDSAAANMINKLRQMASNTS